MMSQAEIDGVKVTNPDKELFDGVTKSDFVEYYSKVQDKILPHLKGRPLTLYRFPDGIDDGFYQKEAPGYFPDFIDRYDDGKTNYAVCNSKKSLLYLANQVCEFHIWTSRDDKPGYPDKMVFDLDPQDENMEVVREVAGKLKKMLENIGMRPYIMTTGGKGYHIVTPIEREFKSKKVYDFSKRVADTIRRSDPDKITTEFSKEKRGKKMFIDVKRNSPKQTSVAPYSIRARPGAPIATPIRWEEIETIEPDEYNIGNARTDNPWKNFQDSAVSLKDVIDNLQS